MEENIENQESELINWKSIIIGSIIPLSGYMIVINGPIAFFDSFTLYSDVLFFASLFLAPVLGGFVTAYMNKPIYNVGVINGTLAVVTGLIIFGLFDFYYFNTDFYMFGEDIASFIVSLMFYLIPILFLGSLGSLGAVIGTSIKKLK